MIKFLFFLFFLNVALTPAIATDIKESPTVAIRAIGNAYLNSESILNRISNPFGNIYENPARGTQFFAIAAVEFEDSESAYALGNIYAVKYDLIGGTGPDFKKALYWYSLAGKLGSADALYALGDMCFNGKGVRQDYDLARGYFVAASLSGNSKGAFMLGKMYYEAIGVEQNIDLAIEQFTLSSERGNKEAEEMVLKIRRDINKNGGGKK